MDDDKLDQLLQKMDKFQSHLDGDIDYLKRGQEDLKRGQEDLKRGQDELRAEFKADLRQVNDRLDSQAHTLKVIKSIVMNKTADVAAES